jgi:ATP-binding cassette subfamily C protein
VYNAIAGSTWVYFSRNRASSVLQILTAHVDSAAAAAYYLIDLVVSIVISAAYVVMALRVSPSMTGLVIGCGAVLAVALRGRLAFAQQAGYESWKASKRLHAATSDFLDSMKIAKGYGAEARHERAFSRLSENVGTVNLDAARAGADMRLWLGIGSAALLAAIVYVAQAVVGMSPASLFLLMFLFARLVPRLTGSYEKAQSFVVELPGFQAVIDAERSARAASEPEPTTHREISLVRSVDFEDVSFGYGEPGTSQALSHVTFRISARLTTAIVGPSGAGKSTIADLLMGLLMARSGRVTVDGLPLTAEYLQSWRGQIGYVPQDTLLFHDTVLANLLWAKPDAAEDEVWRALDMAAAADFVRALPQGLETVVGDRGVLISGGERQRLALARALLRRPRLLILDEATSSLDSENELRIQSAIDRLHEQTTIVVITHRLSTIRNADLIHVLDGGRLVESGTWTALASSAGGRFRSLCEAQGIPVDHALLDSVASSPHVTAR